MTVAETARERRFDALFKEYLPDMVAYCGWRSGSAADAQDAVSEVFLAAWRRLEEVPDGVQARLWLYGTARRVMANHARAGRRRAQLSARVAAEDLLASRGHVSPVADAVHDALARLKPSDREVLLLSEWEGLSPQEIAAVMECPVVTARGRLFRARRRFREAYEGPRQRGESNPEPAACASRSSQGAITCS
jgi:RNA polymerase sigma factor (sigma-70 family)